jgi:hypothetical protein
MSKEQTKTSSVKEPKVRVFELVDQQNSSYKLEGTEDVYLTSPLHRVIPSQSIYVDEAGKHHRIRFIKGCQTIFVDEQTKTGWEPSKTGADAIVFTTGKLVATEEGDFIQMFEFLDKTTLNESPSSGQRKSGSTIIFREIIKEVEVKKELDNFFSQKAVYDALGTIAIPDGKGGIQYKKEKIDSLCTLFGLAGFEADAYAEKLQALIGFGLARPESFIHSIANTLAEKRVLVLGGLENGVLGWDKQSLMFMDGGKVLITAESKDKDQKIQEAVEYLLSAEGFTDLQQLEIAVKHANEKKLLASTT